MIVWCPDCWLPVQHGRFCLCHQDPSWPSYRAPEYFAPIEPCPGVDPAWAKLWNDTMSYIVEALAPLEYNTVDLAELRRDRNLLYEHHLQRWEQLGY